MRIVMTALLALGLMAMAPVVSAQPPAKPAAPPAKKVQKPPTPEELARRAEAQKKQLAEETVKVEKALADIKAPAQPKKPRKLLVYTACKGFPHDSIPIAAKAIQLMGVKTGAYEATISDCPDIFAPEKLCAFDAVFADNLTGNWLPDEKLKASLLAFVRGGKGIGGNHGTADSFYQWKDYGDMIGGYFAGHPFGQITVKLDDPKSPINAVFGGNGFDFSDEIYTFKTPYSREKLHLLLSVDMEKSTKVRDAIAKAGEKWNNRKDGDFALSWIHKYGEGRVFYTAFGHQHYVFWTPMMLQHFLAGIQYTLGDLPAEDAPSAK